jgi:mono/diheme cytochrome c family protein
MKFTKIFLILTVFGLFTFACNETKTTPTNVTGANTLVVADTSVQPTAKPDEFAVSRKIYAESCAHCHGAGGAGGEGLFEGKKVKVPGYQSKGAMNASDDKLYDYIANGEEGEMPAFKNDLSEEEMRNLVRFIRHEFQKK